MKMTEHKTYSGKDTLKSMSTEDKNKVFTEIYHVLRNAKKNIDDITKKGYLFPLNDPEWDNLFDAYDDICKLVNKARGIASDMIKKY